MPILIKNFLRYVIFVGIFALPLVPLLVANSLFFPFITGKVFFFRIAVEIIFAAWLILALFEPEYRPRFSPILIAFGAFNLVLILATFFGANPYRSFWSNFERSEGLLTHLHLLAYMLVAFAVMKTENQWAKLFHVSLGVSAYLGVFGLFQLAGLYQINQGGSRLDGTLGNATYFSVYMLFHFFIALYYWVQGKTKPYLPASALLVGLSTGLLAGLVRMSLLSSQGGENSLPIAIILMAVVLVVVTALVALIWWWSLDERNARRWFYGVMIFMSVAILLNTLTRGTTLGLVVGLAVTGLVVMWQNRDRRLVRRLFFIAMVVLVVAGGGFYLARDSQFVQSNSVLSRFAPLLSAKGIWGESASRRMVWGIAWAGFKERPILGWGPENYNLVFNKYYNPKMFGQEAWFDRAHNVFFDWLTSAGLLGLVSFLSIWLAAIYSVWGRRFRSCWSGIERAVISGLLAAYFVHSIFVFDVLVSYWLFVTILTYLASRSLTEDAKQKKNKLRSQRTYWPKIGLAVLVPIGLILVIYWANVKPWRASRELVRAISFFPDQAGAMINEHLEQKQESFQKVFAANTMANAEASEQYLMLASRARGLSGVRDDLKLKFMNAAVDEIKNQIARAPLDARPPYFLGTFYVNSRQLDLGIDYLEQALSLSPNKQMIMFDLASAYAMAGEFTKTEALVRQAYELAPESETAAKFYALVLLELKRGDEALKIIGRLSEAGQASLDDRFINAFDNAGLPREVLRLWQKKVEQNGANPQFRFSLAAAYLKVGDYANAIKELEAAKKIEPGVTEQADKYISEIRRGKNPLQK